MLWYPNWDDSMLVVTVKNHTAIKIVYVTQQFLRHRDTAGADIFFVRFLENKDDYLLLMNPHISQFMRFLQKVQSCTALTEN